MARPQKNGVDYFPLDVDFLQDKKVRLLLADLGAVGLSVYLYLLCEVYRNGYFKRWDEDDNLLCTGYFGQICNAETVADIVDACVTRGLFHKRLFKRHHILTSAGIQRRYLRAISTREEIRICADYFLLDANNKRDVPTYIKNKLVITHLPRKRKSQPTPKNENIDISLFDLF